ncbi:MAG TPA: MerR family transcriptional regulator [Steroidobacteraceae bacterium]|nr:MerR family transcriptional regulator [Steroidobacteraceae bacterium]
MDPFMKELTVKQLAAISGVTVRTLHHYDEIGLLKPASVGANGYRYYGRKELLRLQRILFHRELGVPLSAIPELLDLDGENQIGVLRQHREKLEAERERYGVLIGTIDRTIADLQGERVMANADLYEGFSPEKQAGYEAWLIERYGEPLRAGIESAKAAQERMAPAERKAFMEAQGKELQDVEEALAGALRNGLEPGSEGVDLLISRHRAWVSAMWGRPCPLERYAGLADLYLAHPDFVARYERIEPGFAVYLTESMKRHVLKWGA